MLNRTMISALALGAAMAVSGAAMAANDAPKIRTDGTTVSNPSSGAARANALMTDEFGKPGDRSEVDETLGSNGVVRDGPVNNPSADDTAMNEGFYIKDSRKTGEPTVN